MNRAHEQLEITQGRLAEIAAVFRAIGRDANENYQVRTLAGLGAYLADDWAGTIDAFLSDPDPDPDGEG